MQELSTDWPTSPHKSCYSSVALACESAFLSQVRLIQG